MQVQTSLDHNYVITCDSVAYGSGLNAPSRSTDLRQSPMGDISLLSYLDSKVMDEPASSVAMPTKVARVQGA